MRRLAIVITHPIQYYSPVFKLLAQQCILKVFYTWGHDWITNKYDPDFGKSVDWDIPLLDGYEHVFLQNTSKKPGSQNGKGIVNPEIISKLRSFNPHAILVYGYIYKSHFSVMRYFKGKIPIWFRGDSTLLDPISGLKSTLKKIYLKWIYSHVDKVFYVGSNNRAYFENYGVSENKLFFAPHAIDNERFSTSRSFEAKLLRNKLNIGKDDTILLFAGKFETKKNPIFLLNVFDELVSQNRFNSILQSKGISSTPIEEERKVHLLFVGNGILETTLKNICDDKRLSKYVHFMDFQNQSEMPVIYQTADIFCLPSKGPGETWGLSVNEAMASGCVTLISDKVGCAKDLVKNNKTGFIINLSEKDWVQKISDIIWDKNKLQLFKNNGRHHIKNWSFQLQVDQLISQLNEEYKNTFFYRS